MAEPVGSLRVEIEASTAQFTADLGKAKDAARRFSSESGAAFSNLGAAMSVTSRQFQAVSTATRVAANTFVADLNPALASTISEMASVGQIARASGGSIGTAFAAVGIAAAIAALGLFITHLQKARKEQEDFNASIRSFDVTAIIKAMETITAEQNKLIATNKMIAASFVLEGIPESGEEVEVHAKRIRELDERYEQLNRTLAGAREIEQAAGDELAALKKAQEDSAEATKKHAQALKDLAEMMAQVNAETRQAAGKELADIMAAAEEQAAGTAELSLAMSERRFKVIRDTRTEAEKFQAALEALNELQVDAETHARAVEQLEQNWSRAVGGVEEYKQTVTDAQKLAISLMDLFALQVSAGMADVIFEANSAAEAFGNLAKEIAKAVVQFTIMAGIKAAIGALFSGLGGGGVQDFQHGGMVPGPIGQPRLAMVHGGEMITPPGEGGAGTINIAVDARGAERGVGVEVHRAIVAAMNQVRQEVVPIVDEGIRRGGKFRSSVRG